MRPNQPGSTRNRNGIALFCGDRSDWKPLLFVGLLAGLTSIPPTVQAAPIPPRAASKAAKPPIPKSKHGAPSIEPGVQGPTRLVYLRKQGDSRRYEVTAFFHGHIPPFAVDPSSEPINLKAKLEYTATVLKANATSADVEFHITKADLSVLDQEPGPDGKVNPDGELPFPIALADVQKALNVTVTLRPDGSIANIIGGDTNQVKINVGFELRKLFLLTMPVIFPDRVVKPGDSWPFDDGVLGHKPGSVTYQAKLESPVHLDPLYLVDITAQNNISDLRDKTGKPVTDAADAEDTTTGTVTVEGKIRYVTVPGMAGATGSRNVRVSSGTLTMNAMIHRKKTFTDPNHPEDRPETNMDVRARMYVRALPDSVKTASATAGTK